jgi:hypothetical protein
MIADVECQMSVWFDKKDERLNFEPIVFLNEL